MKKGPNKEVAEKLVKVFPRTHKRLRIQAAEEDMTMAELVEDMSVKRPRKKLS